MMHAFMSIACKISPFRVCLSSVHSSPVNFSHFFSDEVFSSMNESINVHFPECGSSSTSLARSPVERKLARAPGKPCSFSPCDVSRSHQALSQDSCRACRGPAFLRSACGNCPNKAQQHAVGLSLLGLHVRN